MKDQFKTKQELLEENAFLNQMIKELEQPESARKRCEEELIIKDSAIASAVCAIAFFDLEGNVIYVNPAAVAMWGYADEKEVLGKNATGFFHDEHTVSDVITGLSKGEPWSGKLKARKNKGAFFDVYVSANLVKNENGEPLCLMGSAIDITEQERMMDVIIRTEKISSLERLSVGLAHELRNPLAIITSCSQFCLESMKLPAGLDDNLRIIHRNSQRAVKLINDLLVFAKPSKIDWQPVDINETISRMGQMVLLDRPSRDISLEMVLDTDIPRVIGDAQKIGQVFLNVLLNAADALAGQGKITVQSRRLPSERMVEVVITDNGPGIPDENLASIFDPFFTTKENGTGLGLSITRNIVEQHRGRIDAQCGSDGGARISVMFPVHDQEPGRVKPAKRKDNKTICGEKK